VKAIARLGQIVLSGLDWLGGVSGLLFKLVRVGIKRPWGIDDIAAQMIHLGVRSLPITLFLSVFIGMVLAVQFGSALTDFGATMKLGDASSLALVAGDPHPQRRHRSTRREPPRQPRLQDDITLAGANEKPIVEGPIDGVVALSEARELRQRRTVLGGQRAKHGASIEMVETELGRYGPCNGAGPRAGKARQGDQHAVRRRRRATLRAAAYRARADGGCRRYRSRPWCGGP